MSQDAKRDDPDLDPHWGTRATPRVRKFFRLLGFESEKDDE